MLSDLIQSFPNVEVVFLLSTLAYNLYHKSSVIEKDLFIETFWYCISSLHYIFGKPKPIPLSRSCWYHKIIFGDRGDHIPFLGSLSIPLMWFCKIIWRTISTTSCFTFVAVKHVTTGENETTSAVDSDELKKVAEIEDLRNFSGDSNVKNEKKWNPDFIQT